MRDVIVDEVRRVREELLKKREAELVAKLAEVNDRLARMKAAVV